MNYMTALVQLPLVRDSGSNLKIKTPEELYGLCADIGDLVQESFHVVTLDGRNKVINRHMITLGLVDASLVHPREVFRAAIVDSAASIVLCHNHPSGDTTPSTEDIRITKQLLEAGKILGISVIDHVIIIRNRPGTLTPYLSIRESGIVKFEL